jgi:hypothetical protein
LLKLTQASHEWKPSIERTATVTPVAEKCSSVENVNRGLDERNANNEETANCDNNGIGDTNLSSTDDSKRSGGLNTNF